MNHPMDDDLHRAGDLAQPAQEAMTRLLSVIDQRVAQNQTSTRDEIMTETFAWSLSEQFNQPNRRIVIDAGDETFIALGEHAVSIARECSLDRLAVETFTDTGNPVAIVTLSRSELEMVIQIMGDRGFDVLTVEVID